MYISNATGCSSIWGGSAPSTPYTVNRDSGRGPAWANSLFEDNAEHGLGIYLGQKTIREKLIGYVTELANGENTPAEAKAAAEKYLATKDDGKANEAATKALIAELEKGAGKCELCDKILAEKSYLSKKSVWIFGGDGWAYDIGFGGLDHVIASAEDVNIMVFDTEVYSNTGGQASKASNIGQDVYKRQGIPCGTPPKRLKNNGTPGSIVAFEPIQTLQPILIGRGRMSARREGSNSWFKVANTTLCPISVPSPIVIPPWSCTLHPLLKKTFLPTVRFFPQSV